MARGWTFTAVGLTVLIALVLVHPTCCATTAMVNHTCSASSCGNIHNVSLPFRLKSDPKNCGDPLFELSCENNRTVLYLFGRKYYVEEISYNNYTIRIVDSSIRKENYFSFSTPTNYSLSQYYLNFYSPYYTYLQKGTKANYRHLELSRSLALMSCEKPVNSPLYLDISTCSYNDNSSSISDSKRRHRYVKVGRTNASQVEDSCQVEKMFRTSWPTNNDDPNISCTDVLNDANHVRCDDSTGVLDLILEILRVLGYLFAESAHWWNAISGVSPYSLSMSGSGNPQLYRPHDVFTAMGRCWVLEDEFSYPINPNLRNSAYVHNTMRQEWDWLFREQQMFYDELTGFKLPVPRRLASQMPRDTIDELRKALNRIREENNRMKIRLNRYRTQVEIRESVEGGWYEHAQFIQSLLADPIYQSDVEMSDED